MKSKPTLILISLFFNLIIVGGFSAVNAAVLMPPAHDPYYPQRYYPYPAEAYPSTYYLNPVNPYMGPSISTYSSYPAYPSTTTYSSGITQYDPFDPYPVVVAPYSGNTYYYSNTPRTYFRVGP